MSITNNSRRYFEIEKMRARYAEDDRILELKKTYIRPIELRNNNSGNFWDTKFNSRHEKTLVNYMEEDRNSCAVKWMKQSVSKNAYTLNIGSGDGNLESLIHGLEINHLGFDIATKTLKMLHKKYPKFKFVRKNILEPVGAKYKKRFQAICMLEVLEHISPKSTFLALTHVNEMLSPGGVFLVSVPLNEGLEEMYPKNPNEHLRCYTPELIKKELEIAGFQIEKIELFFAFSKYYSIKKAIVRLIGMSRWKPNNILLLCTK